MEIRFDNAVNMPPIHVYEGQTETLQLDFTNTPVSLAPPFIGKIAYDPNGYNPAGEITVTATEKIMTMEFPVLQAGDYYFDIHSEANGIIVTGTIKAKATISRT